MAANPNTPCCVPAGTAEDGGVGGVCSGGCGGVIRGESSGGDCCVVRWWGSGGGGSGVKDGSGSVLMVGVVFDGGSGVAVMVAAAWGYCGDGGRVVVDGGS
nr:hypothetical protein [Tanacetum cinerariifolium]